MNKKANTVLFILGATEVNLDEERDELEGSYDRQEYSVGFGAGRWFSKTGFSQGCSTIVCVVSFRLTNSPMGYCC